jgi:hypothetical protein
VSGFWKGISFCYPENQGNDWFGTSFCAEMGSSECGTHGDLDVTNDLLVHNHLTIFGIDIPLLEGDAQIHLQSGKVTTDHYLSFLGQNIEPLNIDQTIFGPGAVIPIGPVPLTITSQLALKFSVNEPKPNFVPIVVNDCKTQGVVGISRDVSMSAVIDLEAAVDALVAKAGIDGKLIPADDGFGLGIDSKIQPAANAIRVTPNLHYHLKHLAGSLNLFVEVDLLIATKRFEVTLVDLGNGFGTNGQEVIEPLDTKTFRAVKTGLSF